MFPNPFPEIPVPGLPNPGLPAATPVGTVVAYAGKVKTNDQASSSSASSSTSGDSIPENDIEGQGWMVCDGRALKKSEYPELFAVIGYLYGGKCGTFDLPDYRGQFLRGLADNKDQDPGFPYRKAPAKGEKQGIGSSQEWMVQTHEHKYTNYPTSPALKPGGSGKEGTENKEKYTTGLYADDTGEKTLTGEETRPKNLYVYYIIKFTNRPDLYKFGAV